MFSSKWKWNHFALCGFRLPQKSRKAHKSSTIEIVNSGILSDRCHFHCHTFNMVALARMCVCVSEWIYVDEFCVRENVFIFRSPFFSLVVIFVVVACCLCLLNDCWFKRFQSFRLTLPLNDVWFLCNRVCTHTQNQIDNDFRQSIITFLLYIRPLLKTKISYKPSKSLLLGLSVYFKLFWYTKIASFCVTTKWFALFPTLSISVLKATKSHNPSIHIPSKESRG